MTTRNEAYLRISTDGDNISVLVSLAGENDGTTLRVPFCDRLILALTHMLTHAHEAIEQTIPTITDAFEAMSKEENAVKAAELFNAVIGVPVYSVEQK